MNNETYPEISELFYRLDENGNAAILFAEDGEPATRLDANVYPLREDVDGEIFSGSLNARYEHPEGIVLSVEDATALGIQPE